MKSYLALLLLLSTVTSSAQADWPTYRHDNARSGFTSESLPPEELKQAWHYATTRPPQMSLSVFGHFSHFRRPCESI